MHPSGVDIDTVADAVRLLLRLGVFRVCDCQLAGEDEVCRQAGVRMWRVVCVADRMLTHGALEYICVRKGVGYVRAVSPGEDV
jgi:hypothetical protein